jgi:hypothetical protein
MMRLLRLLLAVGLLATCGSARMVQAADQTFVVAKEVQIKVNMTEGNIKFDMGGPANAFYKVASISATAVNPATSEVINGISTFLEGPGVAEIRAAGDGRPEVYFRPGTFTLRCARSVAGSAVNVEILVTMTAG